MRLTLFALRNLARNKRRTGAMVAVIGLGTTALLLAGGYAAATFTGLRDQTIRNGLGHLQIGGPGFTEEQARPLASGLADVDALRHTVAADSRVKAVASRVDFTGLASRGDHSVAVLGRGVEPEHEYARAGFAPRMLSGRPVAEGASHEAIAAAGLARSLSLKVGDRLTLLSATVDGAINGLDTEIVGIYTTGVRELDERSVVVRVDTAQALLNTDRVSKLVVLLNSAADTEPVRDALLARLNSPEAASSPFEIRTWSELATFYHQVRGLYSGIFGFLGLIITGLVILSAGNAMTMTVMERVREIGTLRALGTGRLRILSMFIAEGLGLGLIGGGLGLALAATLATTLSGAGIVMPPPPTFTSGIPLQIAVVGSLYWTVLAVMVATVGIAAVLPAARAARLHIIEALGHV
jgi:putative ABC transport system permease protein